MKLMQKTILTIALVCVTAANAQNCNENIPLTTPDSRFFDNGDGTVQDRYTGLIWMRCALGQIWDGATCSGSAIQYSFQQALQVADSYTYADSSAWHVPNIKELKSIVEFACYDMAININIFPNTQDAVYWTSSPDAFKSYGSFRALGVYFYGGNAYDYSSESNQYVRLVRSDND